VRIRLDRNINLQSYNMINRFRGVYNVIGQRGSNFEAKIIPIKVDEDVSTPKDMIIDEQIMEETLTCTVARCSLPDSFIMSSKVLPMYYVTVFYKRSTLLMELFRIYFCFTIDMEIKNANQLINSALYGKFHFELRRDGEKKMIALLKEYAMSEQLKPAIQIMVKEKDKMLEEKYGDASQYKVPEKFIKLSEVNYDDD
jgi:hypothetical protein